MAAVDSWLEKWLLQRDEKRDAQLAGENALMHLKFAAEQAQKFDTYFSTKLSQDVNGLLQALRITVDFTKGGPPVGD